MITRPFDFARRLRPTRSAPDAIPFVNLALLLLFFGLFGQRWIATPGLRIDFPNTRGSAVDYVPTARVLTVGENSGREMLIFDGRVLNLDTLARAFAERPVESPDEVLLLRLHRGVQAQLQVRILELARQAGFASVQIATEPERAASAPF